MIRALLVAAAVLASTAALAQSPRTIPYQGYLTTLDGVPVNATLQMTFALYPQQDGGAAVWGETQTVPVSNGQYSVMLGTVTPLPEAFNAAYFLGVKVGTDAEMAPRQALGAVPYSLFASAAGCKPGDMITCYEGAAGTMNVGPCRPGVRTCNEQGTGFGACTGQVVPGAELCGDVLDNNCNGAINEGCTGSCTVGVPLTCGVGACLRSVACLTGLETCTPGSASTEVCNGVDDNCDGATDNGAICALANAGSICAGGACQVQTCNSGFGNCDFNHANGCERPLNTLTNCGGCNLPCNLPNSNESCSTGTCRIDTCVSGNANVDGITSNGCEVNLNNGPACTTFQNLGTVSGDTGADVLTISGIGERWFSVSVNENNSDFSGVYLSTQVSLSSPAGANYDLFVYCGSCESGTLAGSSQSTGTDSVNVRWEDDFGEDDDGTLLVEVRFASGTSAANWTLTVRGNIAVTTATCNF